MELTGTKAAMRKRAGGMISMGKWEQSSCWVQKNVLTAGVKEVMTADENVPKSWVYLYGFPTPLGIRRLG